MTNHIGTVLWAKYILSRFNKNQNFICITVGNPGSGKSYCNLRMAEIVDPNFSINKVAFSPQRLLDLIQKERLPKGSAIVFEEAGVGMASREFFKKENIMLGKIFQTMRYRGHAVFINVPDLSMIDKIAKRVSHAMFRPIHIDHVRRVLIAKAYLIKYTSDGKEMTPFLKGSNANGNYTVQTIELLQPSVELRHAYEKKKDEFVNKLYNQFREELDPNKAKKVKYSLQQKRLKEILENDPNITIKAIAEKMGFTIGRASQLKRRVLEKMGEERDNEEGEAPEYGV